MNNEKTRRRFPRPTTPLGRGLSIAAAVALILAVVLLVWNTADGGEGRAPTEADMAETVVVCDDFSMTNTQLSYYFWNEYYYMIEGAGDALPASLDPSKPLSEQIYDGETTWEDCILEQTLLTVRNTMSMVFEAEKAGFTLPETYEASLESVLESQREGAEEAGCVDETGTVDVDAYLEASYGPGADQDSFRAYLEDSYLAAAYSDYLLTEPEFTEQEISDYYDLYADDYAASGVAKDDTALRSVRVILIKPSENTDEAWSEAEASAQTLLSTWQAESGSEADFAALAQAHSAGKTAADGGLLSELAPSDLSGDLAVWAFEEGRLAGDTAVVRSDEGWNVAYYVGEGTGTVWQKTAEADLRLETYQNTFRTISQSYDFRINYDAVAIAVPQWGPGGSTAESSSAGG